MGVPYLVRNLENICGRLPFKITFNTENNCYMESDSNIYEYEQIGKGILKYIGIDGSVIIHSKVKSTNRNNNIVHIKENAKEIVITILKYIEMIIIFFDIFNPKDNNDVKKEIILHFVIDGKPPCNKNRRKIFDEKGNETYIMDAYSLMPLDQKEKLHRKIIKYLSKNINNYNNNNDNSNKIKLLTNINIDEFYSYCTLKSC